MCLFGTSFSFLGHKNNGSAPVWLQNQQFWKYLLHLHPKYSDVPSWHSYLGWQCFIFLLLCLLLLYLAVFVLTRLLGTQAGLFWAVWMCECKQYVWHTLWLHAGTVCAYIFLCQVDGDKFPSSCHVATFDADYFPMNVFLSYVLFVLNTTLWEICLFASS